MAYDVIADIAKEFSEDMEYVREAIRISRERKEKEDMKKLNKMFTQDTKVTVYNLGDNTPGEFKAIVKGVYASHSYILEMIDFLPGQNQYSNIVVVFGCVKEGWKV